MPVLVGEAVAADEEDDIAAEEEETSLGLQVAFALLTLVDFLMILLFF